MVQSLSNHSDRPLVALLAETLLWKAATPGDVADQCQRWEERLNALPLVLQTGPLQLLSHKMDAAGLAKESQRIKLSLQLTPLIEKSE